LSKNKLYTVIVLSLMWIVLREEITLLTVATGILISSGCVYFCHRFLPWPKSAPIRPLRLIAYLFYLLWQVLVGGLLAIHVVLTDAHVEIVEVKTKITNMFLRTILVNSITFVPGSVSLDLQDDTITVLWLQRKKVGAQNIEHADELLKGKLERMLIKVQK